MATDQELLSALRTGKPQGLEAAIGQYSAYVAAVIDYQLGDLGTKADVEELSADVFYTLWQWRNRLKTDHLRGWLGTTARNIARDFLRKKRLSTVAAEDYLTVCDAQAQTLLEQIEVREYAGTTSAADVSAQKAALAQSRLNCVQAEGNLQIALLELHRDDLLDNVHSEERKISCLDYLLYWLPELGGYMGSRQIVLVHDIRDELIRNARLVKKAGSIRLFRLLFHYLAVI